MKGVCAPGQHARCVAAGRGGAAMRPPFLRSASSRCGMWTVLRRLAAAIIKIVHGSSKSGEYVRKTPDIG